MATLIQRCYAGPVAEFRFLYGQWQLCSPGSAPSFSHLFRFLYGQWQRLHKQKKNIGRSGSDSSMGNGNFPISFITFLTSILFRFLYGQWQRSFMAHHGWYKVRSDSSMGNGNDRPRSDPAFQRLVQIPLWAMATRGTSAERGYDHRVQIPLWAMATYP